MKQLGEVQRSWHKVGGLNVKRESPPEVHLQKGLLCHNEHVN